MGLRSSCEASATKRALPVDRGLQRGERLVGRTGQPGDLVVRCAGSGTRRERSAEAVIAAISLRMPSTGRNARRVTSQVAPPTTSSRTGRPASIDTAAVPTAPSRAASDEPAWTIDRPALRSVTSMAAKR